MSARSIGWNEEHDLEERRRSRNAMYVSIAIHASLFAALVISPPVSYDRLPDVVNVELIAGPPMANPAPARSKGRPQSKPKAPAPEPPAEAAPEPPAPAPPPPPKAPVAVLPENAPKPDKKVKQAPEKKTQEVAKADTKPPEKPVKKPAEKKDESLSYDDAMKSLDDELGEDETEDLLEAAPARPQGRAAASNGATESSSGVQLSPQDAAWVLATRRHLQMRWVTPANFRNRGLATVMELELSATGVVLGEPKVVRQSGDPYFDDNAIAAVLKSSPLPPPPRAGKTAFIFSSEEN